MSLARTKTKAMVNAFWTGGPKAYATSKRKEFNAAVADLQSRRKQCESDVQREAIDAEIQQLTTDFKSKPGNDGKLLF